MSYHYKFVNEVNSAMENPVKKICNKIWRMQNIEKKSLEIGLDSCTFQKHLKSYIKNI